MVAGAVGLVGYLGLWGGCQPYACAAVAIAGVQGRLVCNLIDGMVATEHGRGRRDGAFWNEFPDRITDTMLLWGFGLALGQGTLGVWVALAAMGTAYIRLLGVTCGTKAYFSGPFAKQQRMAYLTVATVVMAIFPLKAWGAWIVGVLLAGTITTATVRAGKILKELNA